LKLVLLLELPLPLPERTGAFPNDARRDGVCFSDSMGGGELRVGETGFENEWVEGERERVSRLKGGISRWLE